MTRESILILVGILVALSPWIGLPLSWLMYVLVVAGLITAGIGWSLSARRQHSQAAPVPTVVETLIEETVVEVEMPRAPEPAPVVEQAPEASVEEAPAVPAAPAAPVRRRRPSVDMPSRANRIAKF